MENLTSSVVILELVSIAVVCLFIWLGACKGFVRTIAQIVAYIVIFAISSTLSRALAPLIYDQFIAPSISESIQDQFSSMENAVFTSALPSCDTQTVFFEQLSGTTSDIQVLPENSSDEIEVIPKSSDNDPIVSSSDNKSKSGLLERILAWIKGLFSNQPAKSDALPEWVPHLSEDTIPDLTDYAKEQTTEWIDSAIRPIAISSLTAVTFAILFILLSVIGNILLRLLGVIDYIPVLGRLNRFLGGVLGFLEGLLILWIIGLLLGGLVKLGSGSWWIFTLSDLKSGFLFPLLSNPFFLL